VIGAGLGAGPTEYLALRLHSFPASTTARGKWGGDVTKVTATRLRATAYQDLAAGCMDECGLVRLATRTVAGATAAALVIAEVLRLQNGGPLYEVIDMTLRDPASRAAVTAAHRTSNTSNWNPGFTA